MSKMKGFLSGTDVQRSLNLADNRLVNLYPTTNDDGTVGALVATPGLELYKAITAGAIASGIYTTTVGRCFMVAGTTLYEITTGGTLTSRGTVTAGTVSRMTDNGIELIIVNGTDGWLFTFATNVLAQITAAAFPDGCKTVSYMNGRFVVCEPSTQNMYVSDRLAGGTWDALNVATVDSNPDRIIGQVVSHNELVIFCEDSGEAWYDTDQYPVPFVRNESGIFEVGCISPYSITKIDNSVMWLGKSSTGLGVIYRLNGYTPTRISTYSIEYAIQQMTDTSDAIAYTYQQDGHHFYVINFPTGNKTFAYDVNTQMWHERANFSTVTGNFSRWEAQEYAYFDGKHLVCDYTEGNIYSLEMDVYTDGADTRKWLRSWRAPATNMKRVIHSKLTLEMESGVGLVGGVDPQVMLRYSNDGGHNWSSELWKSMGAIGDFSKRVIWHRLGMTGEQPRVYEISGNTPVKTILLAAYLE